VTRDTTVVECDDADTVLVGGFVDGCGGRTDVLLDGPLDVGNTDGLPSFTVETKLVG
jgi:hypothetical protein